MPPADSPVDATDRATPRRWWNQRVTTVVIGTRPRQRPAGWRTRCRSRTGATARWAWPSTARATRHRARRRRLTTYADVVAGDQPGGPHPDDAADEEEPGGRERDRRDLPTALLAERVEVHRQPVEPEPRRRGEHDEAAGDHVPTREPVSRDAPADDASGAASPMPLSARSQRRGARPNRTDRGVDIVNRTMFMNTMKTGPFSSPAWAG